MNILSYIYIPFSYVMKGCLWITGNNYFFALFFFALVFQIILFPFAIKQQKSQVSMAKIRPKEQAIRKKYAGRTDKVTQQKMQTEIQEMYQKEGYNPLSGCLPLLIQLPLILILYAIVRCPVQYSSNFTDQAKTEIQTVLGSENTDEDLQTVLQKYVVGYVENIRENLTTTDEGKSVNESLVTLLSKNLGATKVEDATFENGYEKYEVTSTSSAGYVELYIADVLANYGKSYTDGLLESGALASTYDAEKYPLSSVDAEGEETAYSTMLPDFTFLGINLLHTPSLTGNTDWKGWILLLIPILVFVTSYLNTKITKHFNPTTQDANAAVPGNNILMNIGLPAMSAVFTFMFPAAIGVYWVWRTLITMIQPVILNKMYPMPVFTKEDYEAAERELKGSQKKKKVITIEVDEDDNSFADMEVKNNSNVDSARPKEASVRNAAREDLPYRKPSKIEMLSADDDDSSDKNQE